MKNELKPTNGNKSFYGKAYTEENGATVTLYSYGTKIAEKNTESGEVKRLWDGWTATTGRHIKAFCGMGKAEFTALPLAA